MFEKASRMKLRIESAKGLISVEDLWDIDLIARTTNGLSLDNIAKGLYRKVKDMDTTSFVVKAVEGDTRTELAFDIVKHIIAVRLAEADVRRNAESVKAKNQKILEIIGAKENEKLMSASLEELRAMLGEA